MASSRIEEIERRRLGHMMSQKTTYTGASSHTMHRYTVYPISLTRPVEGLGVARILCPACRDHIGVVVASEKETLKKRRSWLYVALCALGILLIMIPATVLIFIHAEDINLPGLAILILCSAIVTLYHGLAHWATYSGISWASDVPQSVRRDHALFREDEYQEYQKIMDRFRK